MLTHRINSIRNVSNHCNDKVLIEHSAMPNTTPLRFNLGNEMEVLSLPT